MFILILLFLWPTFAYSADLAWNSPPTRACWQHVAGFESTGRWSGIRNTSDCPSDNPANTCSTRAGWKDLQSPSDDKSCPLWFLVTEGMSEDDYQEQWDYDVRGGYGTPITLDVAFEAPGCERRAMAFEWRDVNHSFRNLSSTYGPDLENISELSASVAGYLEHTVHQNCQSTSYVEASVSVRYPNNHVDTVAVVLYEDRPQSSLVRATNYDQIAGECGNDARTIECYTQVRGAQMFTGESAKASSPAFVPWKNNTATHTEIDFRSLFDGRAYAPAPPSGYALEDAQISRIRFSIVLFGGSMKARLSDFAVTIE